MMTNAVKYPNLTNWIKIYARRELHSELRSDRLFAERAAAALLDLNHLIANRETEDLQTLFGDWQALRTATENSTRKLCLAAPESD